MTAAAPRPSRTELTAPKAAAIAGIVFSVLFITSLVLFLVALPATVDTAAEFRAHRQTLILGLNLIPFAGIAFLWFMGLVRDRLDSSEYQFFSTVFFGRGLLFIAMLFTSTAVTGIAPAHSFRADHEHRHMLESLEHLLNHGAGSLALILEGISVFCILGGLVTTLQLAAQQRWSRSPIFQHNPPRSRDLPGQSQAQFWPVPLGGPRVSAGADIGNTTIAPYLEALMRTVLNVFFGP